MAFDVDALKGRAAQSLKSFAPAQLVIIGLLSVVGITGAVFFLRWVSTPSYGVLLAGLEAKDAAAVTAKLQSDGVPYKLEGGGTTVLVPQSAMDKERIAVAAAGLPAGSTQDGWAAFDKQGLTSSSFQQQVAYQRALEATLAGSLQDIDGVRSAQVHLALPEKRLFSDNQDPARAAVLVQTNGTLSDSTVDAMTHLVSSAVPGMSPKDVSITDGSGTLLTGDGTSTSKTDAARRSYEDALSAQVGSMFDTLLGPGHAVVRVNAEMDNSNTTIDSQVYDPQKTAVLSQSSSKETYAAAPTTTTGGALTSANAVGAVPTTTTTTSKTNGYSKSDSSTTNGVSVTTSHQVLAPGGVKRLTVAVAVDSNAKNAPSTADIQAMVAAAVGLDPRRGDSISVTTPAFLMTTKGAGKGAGGGGSSSAASPVDQVQHYGPQALGALLLLFVGFGFLRTVRSGTSTEIPAAQVTAAVEAGRRGALVGRPAAALPPGSVPVQRNAEGDLLSTLDESPDEVAGLLRGWLANAGPGER
ncbi:MAG: flagellar basal-body MS-ring/collar protein FliF [Mycobacteriales bacterium]